MLRRFWQFLGRTWKRSIAWLPPSDHPIEPELPAETFCAARPRSGRSS